ncbi:peptidylprolyl isomerase [Buchnera aphidicola]|uniref:Periplasmic chaperone PpiD n=1 Tax=Buchnera aphidicola (Artemisaphis artemisicola) TaxID=1241836 RepID=A0A4D6XQG4_9GAMM|nr:peptidylprolyl isomerase [Buchnera aphidicola]QCI16131.1 peptidylprolyl isomerase [Buchnera aphidicola (Artemisaphis artemisicola)]
MIKFLKTQSSHIIIKIILGIVILSLIFSTMNGYINQNSEKYVAIVNGEKISLQTFKNMYAFEKEKQKKILGKNFFKLSKNKNFINKTYNDILSQLINNVLLEQYTKKMQFEINDYKIKEIILNSSLFQKDHQFNKEKYLNYLNSINLSNHEYISIIKTKINTENLINTIANSNFILKNEQKNILELLSQKRIFRKSIVNVNSEIYKQNVTDKEAQDYFNKYKNNFYIPEKFKINYIQLTPKKFKTTANEEEIHNWYLKNINKYSTKEKRKYSIIQTKTRSEALLILSKLHNKPEDFFKIAKENSIDPISSKNSGSIGWITIDLIPNEIKNANLNKKNEISHIISFRNNFIIVKLDDIIPPKQKKINEVHDIIKKEIEKEKSLNLYHKLQNKISDTIKNKSNQFDIILQENNLSFQNTDWFDKNSIPKTLNIPILKKIIFNIQSLNKDSILKSDPHFVTLRDNQSFLIKIKDFQNKKMQVFSNVKKNIIQKIKFIKATQATKQKAEKIIYQLKTGNTDLFKKSNLYFSNPQSISRYNSSPITSIIFSLPHPKKGKKIYTLYQDINKNFVIISLEKIYNKNFSKNEKNIIIEYLEKNNTETMFNSILENLRKTSIIEYEKIDEI